MMYRVYGFVMCTALLAGVLSQVYVPMPDVNIYFLESGLLTAWLISDAFERKAGFGQTLLWGLLGFILAPIVVPRWFANRPLKPGEWRKGGSDANFFTAFGIITLVYTGVSAACNFLSYGGDHGFELIINSGFAVAGTALVLGLAAKQERVFEKGLPKSAERE